jgi:hypothetical protein
MKTEETNEIDGLGQDKYQRGLGERVLANSPFLWKDRGA